MRQFVSNNKITWRLVIWVIFFVLIAASAVVCALRWKVWFHNKPEPSFVISQSVTDVQLTLGDSASERMVSWRARPDSMLMSQGAVTLLFQNLEDFGSGMNSSGIPLFSADTFAVPPYHVLHNSLGGSTLCFYAKFTPNVGKFRYAISTPDSVTPWFYSQVIPETVPFTCLVLGDIQDKSPLLTTDSIIADMAHNRFTPEYILQLGDLIERPHQSYYQRYFDAFLPFAASVPTVAVAGNHDYLKGMDKHIEERFFYTFPFYLDSDSLIPASANYSFVLGGDVAFIILDSNQPFLKLWKQRKWLKRQFERYKHCKYRIVALHHPIISTIGWWRHFTIPLILKPVIDGGNVDLLLSAHEHNYLHLSPQQTGRQYHQIVSHFSDKDYNSKGEGERRYILLKYDQSCLDVEVYSQHSELEEIIKIR